MALVDLASFPNSRIKPRSATQFSFIGQVTCPADTPTRIRPILNERTVLTIYNQSTTVTLRYKRGNDDTAPANIATDGFVLGPDRAIDLEGPEALWVYPVGGDIDISYDDGVG